MKPISNGSGRHGQPRPVQTVLEPHIMAAIDYELTDRFSNKAIWRGSASSRVNQENPQTKRIARINDAIERMFHRFPKGPPQRSVMIRGG